MLYEIKDHVAHYVGFLAEIIKANIEVVDTDLRKLAGTGVCQLSEGLISGGVIYREALDTGKYVFIDTPRRHPVCERCPGRNRCLEQLEIASPIVYQGKTVGAVGLLCSSREHREQIMGNARAYLFMINTVCGFLAEKAADSAEIKRLTALLEADPEDAPVNRLELLERREIRRALNLYGRDTEGKRKAAAALGIGLATLYRKLEQMEAQKHAVV